MVATIHRTMVVEVLVVGTHVFCKRQKCCVRREFFTVEFGHEECKLHGTDLLM